MEQPENPSESKKPKGKNLTEDLKGIRTYESYIFSDFRFIF